MNPHSRGACRLRHTQRPLARQRNRKTGRLAARGRQKLTAGSGQCRRLRAPAAAKSHLKLKKVAVRAAHAGRARAKAGVKAPQRASAVKACQLPLARD
eukprot:3966849-Prymnesium_polylepis.2